MTDPRSRFEAWFIAHTGRMRLNRFEANGEYVFASANEAWAVWQASLQAHAEEVERLTSERDGALAMQPVLVDIERNKRREAEAERDAYAAAVMPDAEKRASWKHADLARLASCNRDDADTLDQCMVPEKSDSYHTHYDYDAAALKRKAAEAERDALRAALEDVLLACDGDYVTDLASVVRARAALTSPPTPQEPAWTFPFAKVTRFEVITQQGRSVTAWTDRPDWPVQIENIELQNEGRTLKVWLKDRDKEPA